MYQTKPSPRYDAGWREFLTALAMMLMMAGVGVGLGLGVGLFIRWLYVAGH